MQDFIRKQYKRGTIETQEYFNVIYLDRKNSIIGFYRHSKGGVAGTIADLKIVFGIALKSLASSMILSHNHPSNNLKPSQADITLTEKFKEVGKLHDIPVLDHIIVAKQGYYSFADEGLIWLQQEQKVISSPTCRWNSIRKCQVQTSLIGSRP